MLIWVTRHHLRRRLRLDACLRFVSTGRARGARGVDDDVAHSEAFPDGSREEDREMQARIARYFSRKAMQAPPVPIRNKELEAIQKFKQRARRAKELEHKRYQTMMSKVGAVVQRRSVEDTLAKAEQLYLTRAQFAEESEALSVSQCLDALQESLNQLRAKYSNENSNSLRYAQDRQSASSRRFPGQVGIGGGIDMEHQGGMMNVEEKGQADRPKLFESAESGRIKEIAGKWIQTAKVIGNLRVEQEVREVLKRVYGVDIVEKVEEVRTFLDDLDSKRGRLSRYLKGRLKNGSFGGDNLGFDGGRVAGYLEEKQINGRFGADDMDPEPVRLARYLQEVEKNRSFSADHSDGGRAEVNLQHRHYREEDFHSDEEEEKAGIYEGRLDRQSRIKAIFPFSFDILCPMADIIQHLRSLNIISGKTRLPKPVSSITNLPDATIINWFRGKAYLILKQYRPANNLWEVRRLINFHIRYSLIYTLAKKHKSSISKVIQLYGKAPSVKIPTMVIKGQLIFETVADFPSVHEVNSIRRGFDRETPTPQEFIELLLIGCKRDGALVETIPGMQSSIVNAGDA